MLEITAFSVHTPICIIMLQGHAKIGDIEVTRPDSGDTFETTVNKAIPQNRLSFVQPGSVIDVYYLPENERKIAISVKGK